MKFLQTEFLLYDSQELDYYSLTVSLTLSMKALGLITFI